MPRYSRANRIYDFITWRIYRNFSTSQMKEGMYFLTIQTQGSLPLSTTSGFSTISVIQTSIDALPLYTFTPSSLKGSITALAKTTGIWLYAPVVTNTASLIGYFITNHDLNEPVRVWWECKPTFIIIKTCLILVLFNLCPRMQKET